jgi:hypothetical protein
VRPISRLEGDQLIWDIAQKQSSQTSTGAENILLRRLTHKVCTTGSFMENFTGSLCFEQLPTRSVGLSPNQTLVTESLPVSIEPQPAPPEVLEGLYSIKGTPFNQSFASRLYGQQEPPTTVFFQDWETMSPWMELMADVMDHHRISQ